MTVYYYLPDGTHAKDLKVDLGTYKCKIEIKGKGVLEDKKWHKKILADESLWTVERENETGRSVM